MKNLLILGAGTAGTMLANRMVRTLDHHWSVTVVDPHQHHLYQPGLLYLPFGARNENKLVRPRSATLAPQVGWRVGEVREIDPERRRVKLESGDKVPYDILVIATGSHIRPDMTEGLVGDHWLRSAFDFYSLEGATALREALATFQEGRLVVNLVEMPIKCPVAPLEFLFLADEFFRRRGRREAVQITYVTPLDGAFTKPFAARRLGHLLNDKGIEVITEFNTGEVRGDARQLVSWDERQVNYDLLVTIPTHAGAPFLLDQDLGDELGFIPTDKHTLLAKELPNTFVVGDATDLPSSKAGSVAHFQVDGLVENLPRFIASKPLEPLFDGHANCFVETGDGKALLIDFNYEVEPLPGTYPIPGIGPFRLMEPTRINHLGKQAFRWLYWNALLPGRPLPIGARMNLAGKRRDLIQH